LTFAQDVKCVCQNVKSCQESQVQVSGFKRVKSCQESGVQVSSVVLDNSQITENEK